MQKRDGDAGTPEHVRGKLQSGMTRTEVLWKILDAVNAWCEFLCT
ncbi:hypothetical protein SAMN05720758_2630 [Fibrobacter sp. UWB11]|nr:hypothetical protein SAMN05720758_2630 [Fibrobacter sp. UWB11]